MDRDAALVWCAEHRRARQELLDDVASGLPLAEVMARAATDDHVGRIRVLAVLEARPGAGKVASRRLLAGLGISESTPLRDVDADALVAAAGSEPEGREAAR